MNIAIDGPAGAGKSTVARLLANALGYVYIDTGAMYRAVALKALEKGLRPEEEDKLVDLAASLHIDLQPGQDKQKVLVNGEDVTDLLRTPSVNKVVPHIAQIAGIRDLMVARQREIAAGKGVVMDGRDIGTHVMPDAEVKIFLTADARVRAQRRYEEMKRKTGEVNREQLEKDIALRDRMDRERQIAPLTKAKDAVEVDTTNISIEEAVNSILAICQAKRDGRGLT